MTFSPGPWWVDGGRGWNAPIIMAGERWPGKNRRIAKVLYEGGSEDNEVEANARLLAKAWVIPDLVEACELAMETLKHHQADLSYLGELQVVTVLEMAIEKAKGGINDGD